MTGFAHEIRSEIESDEYTDVLYVTDRPRKRDFLKVLFGRYMPQVRRVERLTLKGTDRVLRQAWSPDAIEAQFYNVGLWRS